MTTLNKQQKHPPYHYPHFPSAPFAPFFANEASKGLPLYRTKSIFDRLANIHAANRFPFHIHMYMHVTILLTFPFLAVLLSFWLGYFSLAPSFLLTHTSSGSKTAKLGKQNQEQEKEPTRNDRTNKCKRQTGRLSSFVGFLRFVLTPNQPHMEGKVRAETDKGILSMAYRCRFKFFPPDLKKKNTNTQHTHKYTHTNICRIPSIHGAREMNSKGNRERRRTGIIPLPSPNHTSHTKQAHARNTKKKLSRPQQVRRIKNTQKLETEKFQGGCTTSDSGMEERDKGVKTQNKLVEQCKEWIQEKNETSQQQ